MARVLVPAVLSSVVSCLLTLAAVAGGFVGTPPAAAQPDTEVMRAGGYEVVDRAGNIVAYFGGAQYAPAILEIDGSRVLLYSRIDTGAAGIEIHDEAGNVVWQAP